MSDPLASFRPVLDRALLAFDFDGTLAPIVSRPQDAVAAPGAIEVLRQLAPRVRRLAIVTGRPALTAVELGGFGGIDGLVVLGHYGLQRWTAGTLQTPPPVPGIAAVRSLLGALVPSDARVEDKQHSLVVHTRGSHDPEGLLATLAGPLRTLADAHGLELVPGRLVLELRPPGTDKGGALRALAQEVMPEAVLVAGDDVGDLPLFAAASDFGVLTLRIAVRSSGSAPEVAAAADLAVEGPDALVSLLSTLL